MMQAKKIEYQDGDTTLEAYYAYDDASATKRPTVLIAHDWSGRNDFACHKAEMLAELGYIGFALDMYGKGKIGKDNDEKMALMKPLIDDRATLQTRMLAAFETAKTLEVVNPAKIAAIGFCFGGLCVLDLARSGAELRGVVSFHGLLMAPPKNNHHTIRAKILALHGHDDPMVAPEQVRDFQNEFTKADADWQIHIYSNTKHAFTNPQANDPNLGTIYNPVAEKRSWIAMKDFLAEIFA